MLLGFGIVFTDSRVQALEGGLVSQTDSFIVLESLQGITSIVCHALQQPGMRRKGSQHQENAEASASTFFARLIALVLTLAPTLNPLLVPVAAAWPLGAALDLEACQAAHSTVATKVIEAAASVTEVLQAALVAVGSVAAALDVGSEGCKTLLTAVFSLLISPIRDGIDSIDSSSAHASGLITGCLHATPNVRAR